MGYKLPKYISMARGYSCGGQMYYVVIDLDTGEVVFNSWHHQEVLNKAAEYNRNEGIEVIDIQK